MKNVLESHMGECSMDSFILRIQKLIIYQWKCFMKISLRLSEQYSPKCVYITHWLWRIPSVLSWWLKRNHHEPSLWINADQNFEFCILGNYPSRASKRCRVLLSMGWRESGIVCYHTPCAFCSGVAWACRIYNIVESESDPLTRWPVDLFEKEPLKGKWEVNLHTPTKFGEDPSKDLGVHREQTNKQTLLEL